MGQFSSPPWYPTKELPTIRKSIPMLFVFGRFPSKASVHIAVYFHEKQAVLLNRNKIPISDLTSLLSLWDLRNKHKTKSDVCLFMHILAYAEFGLSIKMIKFAGFLVKISAI